MQTGKRKSHHENCQCEKKSTKKGKLELIVDNSPTAAWGCSLCDCPSFEYTDDAQFCDFCGHTRDAHNPY